MFTLFTKGRQVRLIWRNGQSWWVLWMQPPNLLLYQPQRVNLEAHFPQGTRLNHGPVQRPHRTLRIVQILLLIRPVALMDMIQNHRMPSRRLTPTVRSCWRMLIHLSHSKKIGIWKRFRYN